MTKAEIIRKIYSESSIVCICNFLNLRPVLYYLWNLRYFLRRRKKDFFREVSYQVANKTEC